MPLAASWWSSGAAKGALAGIIGRRCPFCLQHTMLTISGDLLTISADLLSSHESFQAKHAHPAESCTCMRTENTADSRTCKVQWQSQAACKIACIKWLQCCHQMHWCFLLCTHFLLAASAAPRLQPAQALRWKYMHPLSQAVRTKVHKPSRSHNLKTEDCVSALEIVSGAATSGQTYLLTMTQRCLMSWKLQAWMSR